MNPMWKVIFGIVLISGFFVIAPARATIIYVDKNNVCPGSGTSVAPYCSIANAVNVVNAGDTIRIRNAATPYNETIQTNKSGTPSNPITIEPDVGHNPTIRNSGNGGQCSTFTVFDADYWTIQNLNFDATGVTPCWFGAIAIQAIRRNVVGHQILNNTFKNWGGPNQETPANTGMAAVMFDGGALEANQGFWPSGLIKGNTFDSNRVTNITLIHSRNVVVEGNDIKNTKCGRDTDGA